MHDSDSCTINGLGVAERCLWTTPKPVWSISTEKLACLGALAGITWDDGRNGLLYNVLSSKGCVFHPLATAGTNYLQKLISK